MENILASGRRQRFIMGLALSVATIVTAVVLVAASARPGWFVLMFALCAGAAMLLLQARDCT